MRQKPSAEKGPDCPEVLEELELVVLRRTGGGDQKHGAQENAISWTSHS